MPEIEDPIFAAIFAAGTYIGRYICSAGDEKLITTPRHAEPPAPAAANADEITADKRKQDEEVRASAI